MYYIYNAEILRVIDGDTVVARIDLGFHVHIIEHLRLANIDTPEIRTRDLAEKEKGLEAKARLEELLSLGPVKIETEKDTGKYGRFIATIYVKDEDRVINVNEKLVEEGLAEKVVY